MTTAMAMADVLGYAAATLTTVAFVPQAAKTWRTRRTDDLSLGMFSLFVAGIALWLAYGLAIGQWPIIVANALTLGLAGSILYVKMQAVAATRRSRRAVT